MKTACLALLFLGCVARHSEFTPLADAAREGDVAAVRTLLAHGADPNAIAGQNNWTPLMHAIHTAQIKSVQALLDGGADVNRAGGNGVTPLMMAAGYGYTDIVQLLLARGADPKIADGSGYHAVDLAAAGVADIDRFTLFQCHDDTVAALRTAAPSIHVNSRVATWAHAKRCRV